MNQSEENKRLDAIEETGEPEEYNLPDPAEDETAEPEEDSREEQARRRKRGLLYRRIGAGLLLAMAVALGLFLHTLDLSAGKLMGCAACALLVVEALLLTVNLRVSRALQAVLGVACILLLGLGFIRQYYVVVGNRFVERYRMLPRLKVEEEYPEHFTEMESLRYLDMRESTIMDFEPIQSLKSLEILDIRGNYAFGQKEHDALAAALPDCDIRWSVPVKHIHFDSTAEEVDLRDLLLTTDELRALFDTYPEKRFAYRVPLLGERFAPDVEELDLTDHDVDTEVIADALIMLPHVTKVDLRGQKAPAEAVASLSDGFPDVDFDFTFDVPKANVTSKDTWIKISGTAEDVMTYMDFIDYMPKLEYVDAANIELSDEQAEAVRAHANGDKVRYGLRVFGQFVTNDISELYLDGTDVGSVEAVEECIARLPKLKKISLLESGLDQNQCGELFDEYPEIKFVFWIQFGKYRIRTDVTAFSTLLGDGNQYGYNDDTFEPIRYCTDLMMLDLGHNHITSLENFRGLTKLRVLILADNKLTDIAPIVDLKNLEYLELFLNDITDLTPLTELKKLVDFNIFYNPIYGAYTPLKSMPQLQRLWIGGCRLDKNMLADLQRALPKTKINVKGRGSTGKGWRNHPHYFTLKQMYLEGRYIPFDDIPEDDDESVANAPVSIRATEDQIPVDELDDEELSDEDLLEEDLTEEAQPEDAPAGDANPEG